MAVVVSVCIDLFSVPALNVTFNLTEYTVNEGETVDVIVQLCGNATDDVVVTVTMQDGSAGTYIRVCVCVYVCMCSCACVYMSRKCYIHVIVCVPQLAFFLFLSHSGWQ